jgi:hypothetical protein
MRLEARSPSCFSDHYVLKLNGRSIGEYRGRWCSENIEIRLLGRHRLHLRKSSWLGSNFKLMEYDGKVLAEANRSGMFTSAWELALSTGPARLVSAGIFNTAYRVEQGGQTLARADQLEMCTGAWAVESEGRLGEMDLLFIGLIYCTILERRRSSD